MNELTTANALGEVIGQLRSLGLVQTLYDVQASISRLGNLLGTCFDSDEKCIAHDRFGLEALRCQLHLLEGSGEMVRHFMPYLEHIAACEANTKERTRHVYLTPLDVAITQSLNYLGSPEHREWEAERQKEIEKRQVVYFLRNRRTGLIKIGYTKNLDQRIKTLRCASGSNLEILLIINERRKFESIMHRKFSHLRTHGEWFREGKDLLTFIKSYSGSFMVSDSKSSHLDA